MKNEPLTMRGKSWNFFSREASIMLPQNLTPRWRRTFLQKTLLLCGSIYVISLESFND